MPDPTTTITKSSAAPTSQTSVGVWSPDGRFGRAPVYRVRPPLAIVLALAAGWLTWQSGIADATEVARAQALHVATDSTIAMLSYTPDTVTEDLDAARDRLTGPFRDSYSSLIDEVVIPSAIQKRVSAVATVPAAASVSVTENHAVVLMFVNQTTTIGTGSPTESQSSVQVTLDKIRALAGLRLRALLT